MESLKYQHLNKKRGERGVLLQLRRHQGIKKYAMCLKLRGFIRFAIFTLDLGFPEEYFPVGNDKIKVEVRHLSHFRK